MILEINWVDLVDQLPVLVRSEICRLLPKPLDSIAGAAISCGMLIGIFAGLFAVLTLMERKGLGRMQNRLGPNRTGWFGVLQPVADGIKMLTKEDIVPVRADQVLHYLAPVVLVASSLLAFSVIPLGRNWVAVEFDAALLFFFAVGAGTELAIFMAGWSSRNKYALLGAMRAIAQFVSYELPLVLACIPVIIAAGTLSLTGILELQTTYSFGFLPDWYLMTPWGMVGFVLFLVSALAESNRSPFDLPEAESELIAGHLTEYSGFKYALFFMAEYFGMMAISAVGITLYLGGWSAPLPFLNFLPSWFWFFFKLLSIMALFIWVRATLPRLRMDQLMALSWKYLIPIGLVNVGVSMFWFATGVGEATRWVVGSLILLVAYWAITSQKLDEKIVSPRKYRYAES